VVAHCPRCGAGLPADTVECPTCAYGDVEDIVILEAQPPGPARPEPPAATPSSLPRVLAALAILIVVIVAIFAALR